MSFIDYYALDSMSNLPSHEFLISIETKKHFIDLFHV